jgi:hypothetical protein
MAEVGLVDRDERPRSACAPVEHDDAIDVAAVADQIGRRW